MKKIIKLIKEIQKMENEIDAKIPNMAVGGDQEHYEGQAAACSEILDLIEKIYSKKGNIEND